MSTTTLKMDIKTTNEKLQTFWNNFFSSYEPMIIKPEDVKMENNLDKYFKYLGDNAERVLDIGTGPGYCLISTKLFGQKIKYGLGIDTSIKAITVASKTCELSNITCLDFKVGDNSLIDSLPDESFDGIICSNFLDVIPEVTANEVIKNIKRLMKPQGLILLKFNFYLTEELIQKLKMEQLDVNSYTINGILRGVNHTLEEWIDKFDHFSVIEKDEYERIPNGPKDRIVVLKKM